MRYGSALLVIITVATLLQAHPPGWAFECLGLSGRYAIKLDNIRTLTSSA